VCKRHINVRALTRKRPCAAAHVIGGMERGFMNRAKLQSGSRAAGGAAAAAASDMACSASVERRDRRRTELQL